MSARARPAALTVWLLMASLPAVPVAVRAAELLASPLRASLALPSMAAAPWVQQPSAPEVPMTGRVMVPQQSGLVAARAVRWSVAWPVTLTVRVAARPGELMAWLSAAPVMPV